MRYGYDSWNIAKVTHAFLFCAWPSKIRATSVFVRTGDTFGLGAGQVVEGFSGATPLGQAATHTGGGALQLTDILGNTLSLHDMFLGFIPGSIGETSTLAILIGAVILLATGMPAGA